MRPYSPGGALNALATTLRGSLPQASSAHRLRRGLPGYLILFAPHAVAHQCQHYPSRPPSPPVFFRISTHSTATPGIPSASSKLEPESIHGRPGVERRAFTADFHRPPTRPLRPVIPDNARTLRITAAAGTELAGAYSRGTFKNYSPVKGVYNPKAFILHAASLRQTFVHCARFPVAATRRCRFRVSVTLWPIMLSHRLPVKVLVGHYPTN